MRVAINFRRDLTVLNVLNVLDSVFTYLTVSIFGIEHENNQYMVTIIQNLGLDIAIILKIVVILFITYVILKYLSKYDKIIFKVSYWIAVIGCFIFLFYLAINGIYVFLILIL